MPPSKSAEAFRTISEAATELDVPQHVLRHWEEVFGQIRPMRRAGGRRYYRPIDIDVLRGVRVLLYDERYTTKGVQQIFKEKSVKYIAELGRIAAAGQTVDLRPSLNADDGIDRVKTDSAKKNGKADAPDDNADSELPHSVRETLLKLAARLEHVQNSLDEAALAIEAIDLDKTA